MAQKRISRARKRDLEQPDEFLTLTSRLLDKIRTYWKPVSAGFGLLMIILAGILAFGYFSQKAEAKAFVLLNQTMQRHAAESIKQDPQKALEAVTPDFENLFATYGNRQAGMVGRLIFAQMNYQAGQMENAIVHYMEAVKMFPEASYALSAAWSGLGYAQAAASQDEKAINAFKKCADGQDAVLQADALYQLALLYQKTGQEPEYNKIVASLKEKFPGFMYAEMLPQSAGS
jgi:tetratricopeptide (TPR) repeat protein